jgi:hypothetical protein
MKGVKKWRVDVQFNDLGKKIQRFSYNLSKNIALKRLRYTLCGTTQLELNFRPPQNRPWFVVMKGLQSTSVCLVPLTCIPPALTKYLLAQQATFLRSLSLNPNPDSWGVYKTPKTSNRNNSKWSDIKILFLLDQFLTKNVLELYLGKDFYLKNAIYVILQWKSKRFHLFMVVFLFILASWGILYDSQATQKNRSAGWGLSQGVLPAS